MSNYDQGNPDLSAMVPEPFSFEKQTFQCVSFKESTFVMNWSMEPKGKVDPHIHKYSDEHFLITKGEVQFKVDGETLIKKQGDELLVKKGIVHSIVNKTAEDIEVIVSYSPCADIHRMFFIMATLDKSNPGSSVNIAKYFYLVPRLGLKEFSTPQPEMVFKMITLILTIAGTFLRWGKLVKKFKLENAHYPTESHPG